MVNSFVLLVIVSAMDRAVVRSCAFFCFFQAECLRAASGSSARDRQCSVLRVPVVLFFFAAGDKRGADEGHARVVLRGPVNIPAYGIIYLLLGATEYPFGGVDGSLRQVVEELPRAVALPHGGDHSVFHG